MPGPFGPGPRRRGRRVTALGGTPAVLPVVVTLPPSLLGQTYAQLNGTVNPEGLQTTAWFAWGPTPQYGNQTGSVGVGALGQTIGVNTQLTGLNAGTTYHFAMVAQSAAGTVYGQDQTVTLVEASLPSVLVPQFDAPFRLDLNGKPVVVEQGSPEDIGAQIYNVLLCQQGAKLNEPSFGIPSPLFGPVPINLAAVVKAVQAQVPGATVSAIQEAIGSFNTVDVTLTAQVASQNAS